MCFTTLGAQHVKINFALKVELEKHSNKDELFPLFVLGDAAKIKAEVLKLQGEVIRSTGDIVQVKLPIRSISNFSKNTFVQSLPYSGSKGQILSDTMTIHNNVVPIHNGDSPLLSSYTGAGVVYGIIDSGVDLEHLDFKTASGKTRIYRAWDQLTDAICDSAAINNGTCTVTDQNWLGHGTHVAGISVGNGLALNMYGGVAPEATIVVVRTNFSAPNWLSTVVDATDYIYAIADSLNMPCVINASVGDYFGSHDGTDPSALLIDSIINYKEGRAFVCAAGNTGHYKWHVEQIVTADTSFSWLKTNPSSGDVFFEVWSDTLDFNDVDYAFGTNLPSGSFQERGRTPFFNIKNRLGAFTDTIMNGGNIIAIVETYAEIQGDKYSLQVFLDNPDSNTYNFSMLSTGAGKYDFWSTRRLGTSDIVETGLPTVAQYPPIAFYTLPDSNKTTVSSFSCSPVLLTVANFDNRKTYLDVDSIIQVTDATVGKLANTSSLGPDRRGNIKPDIGATGDFTLGPSPAAVVALSLISGPVNRGYVALGGKHRINGGTSMASPVVAGIVALYLEKCPTATMAEIKAAVIGTAKQDIFTGVVPNPYYGYGKVDGFAVLNNSNYNVSIGGDKDICDGDSVLVVSPTFSSYQWSNGDTRQAIYIDTTANDLYVNVTNASGCISRSDTIDVLWHPLPIKPIIVVNGNDTLIYATNLNVQWYHSTGGLTGETGAVHLAQINGDYYVKVTDMFGCSTLSDTVTLTTVGIEQNPTNSFSIYPNPTKGNLIVKLNNQEFQSLRIINLLGEVLVDRIISSHENRIELELSQFAEGVYYLQLNSSDENYLNKLILLR
tara:strand:+ start:5070 stop:7571 length:2502 start_codon:yes stop_codon:yes gene_type:complete